MVQSKKDRVMEGFDMKKIDKLYKLIDERNTWKYDNPIAFDNYVDAVAECFETESEVEEFIKTGKYEYVEQIEEAYEEIVGKFPSDRLEYLFDKFVLTSYPNGIPTGPPRYDAALDEWPQ